MLLWGCNIKSIVNIEGVETVNIACFVTENGELVINDAQSYQLLFSDTANCQNYTPPVIDFNEKTLLAKRTEVNGCYAFYTRSVNADTDDKIYIYEIIIQVGTAGCDTAKQIVNYNWVTVPKVPDKYDVVFKVTYK
ncbi:hypothetical protein C7N43_32910 [Sphingobacteriales bacterium UPWRP_1]|nr:hypothetical protein C7N43_32910 [Sphingobacteriales bacterium UPWRP_1]